MTVAQVAGRDVQAPEATHLPTRPSVMTPFQMARGQEGPQSGREG
jgi:hypothetical protein